MAKKLGVRSPTEPGIADLGLYVAGDNPNLARSAAEHMIAALKRQPGAQIVVPRGIPTVIDTGRFNAFMDKIKGTNIKVLDAQFTNRNRDDVALGVLDATKQAKREKERFVIGGAGLQDIIKRVMNKARSPRWTCSARPT